MELEETLARLLAVAAFTSAIWVCLPDFLVLLGLTRIRSGVLGGPEEVPSALGGARGEDIALELEGLGFAPAGLVWEQLPAHKSFREVIFVSKTGDAFAAMYRLFDNDPPRVAFKTALSGGAFVFTQNYNGGMEANEPTLRAGGLAPAEASAAGLESGAPAVRLAECTRPPLALVLEEHRQRVRRFILEGQTPLRAATVDDYLEADRGYMDHPTVRREFQSSVWTLGLFKLSFLAGVPGLFAILGAGHHVVIAALLAASVSVLLFRYYGHPLVAALDRILPDEKGDGSYPPCGTPRDDD
jgi:hypothetical protein